MTPYEEGRQACVDGIHHRRCPYKKTKGNVWSRLDWLRGYSDQANEDAREEKAKAREFRQR